MSGVIVNGHSEILFKISFGKTTAIIQYPKEIIADKKSVVLD